MRPDDSLPQRVYGLLHAHWGPQNWWPADSRIEMIIGAVLTQNTAWRNVEKAIDALRAAGLLDGAALLSAPEASVKQAIRPAGFYNVKYRRLMAVMRYLSERSYDWTWWQTAPYGDVRASLLGVHGLGPETADCMLLYAFGRPAFVVDAYTRRLFARLGCTWSSEPYDNVAAHLTRDLPVDTAVYGQYHALIVAHCKAVCKKVPTCQDCALMPLCTLPVERNLPTHST